jgi:hypothetical protein
MRTTAAKRHEIEVATTEQQGRCRPTRELRSEAEHERPWKVNKKVMPRAPAVHSWKLFRAAARCSRLIWRRRYEEGFREELSA